MNLLISDRRFEPSDKYDPDVTDSYEEAPFPEYLTVNDRSTDLAAHVIRWLQDEPMYRKSKDILTPLRASFVKPGASRKAADYILETLTESGRRSQDSMDQSPDAIDGKAA